MERQVSLYATFGCCESTGAVVWSLSSLASLTLLWNFVIQQPYERVWSNRFLLSSAFMCVNLGICVPNAAIHPHKCPPNQYCEGKDAPSKMCHLDVDWKPGKLGMALLWV